MINQLWRIGPMPEKSENMQIEKFIVSETASIIEVMQSIEQNGRGIVFVCDENKKILAAVSDGDIRRYILKNGQLSNPISEIANYDCIYLHVGQEDKAPGLMKQKGITCIPVVDENDVFCDMLFLLKKEGAPKEQINVPVVIMAGGKGTRLKPYTDILPKPLIPIGHQTITEHIMDRFSKFGCNSFYMIVNYMKGFIKAYFAEHDAGKEINFVDETEFLGTGGGLKLLQGKMQETFFMSNCDILIDADYAEAYYHHKEQKNLLTLVCVQKEYVIPYGVMEVSGEGQITGLKEKPKIPVNANTGMYIIEPKLIDMIPDNTHLDITDIIEMCLEKGERVGAYLISDEQWMDMGQMSELQKMKEKLGFE